MITDFTHATVLVEDVDEAIDWYTETLGFELRSEEVFQPGMRWVTVAPEGATTEVVLLEPTDEAFGEETAAIHRSRIGEGTTWVFATDDCRETIEEHRERGVTITTEPEEVP